MSVANLVESLEWLLKHAGWHIEIDIYTVRKVLNILKGIAAVLLLAGTVNAQPVFVPIFKPSSVIVLNCPSGHCSQSRGYPARNSTPARNTGTMIHSAAVTWTNTTDPRGNTDEIRSNHDWRCVPWRVPLAHCAVLLAFQRLEPASGHGSAGPNH